MIRGIWTIGVVLFCLNAWAQYDCNNYHKFNCPRSGDRKFNLNGQSKSAMVQVGVETDLNVIVYRGQDYRISLCADRTVLGENVQFQILQNERVAKQVTELETDYVEELDDNGEPTGELVEVKRTVKKDVYVNELKVLYDNRQDDMSQEIEFSITSTKRLIIRVLGHGPEKVKIKKNAEQMDIGCVGVLLEHMPTPELGF